MKREDQNSLSVFQFESSVAVRDRVAFACMFLSDAQVTQHKAFQQQIMSHVIPCYSISCWTSAVHDQVAFSSDFINCSGGVFDFSSLDTSTN